MPKVIPTRSKVVLFDVDGVLADFVQGFTARAHDFDPSIPVYGTKTQATWEFAEFPSGLVDRLWETIKSPLSLFWLSLPPLASHEEFRAVAKLATEHDVYFVTSRVGRDAKVQTELWLKHRGVNAPTVIISSKKGEVARALRADFAVDDKAENAVYGAYESPRTKWFLIDRPYNRFNPEVLGSKVTRVTTVLEFIEEVGK